MRDASLARTVVVVVLNVVLYCCGLPPPTVAEQAQGNQLLEPGSCTTSVTNNRVSVTDSSKNIRCVNSAILNPVWFKGANICSIGEFKPFNDCNGQFLCTVQNSSYTTEEASFFCCAPEGTSQLSLGVDKDCHQITLAPVVTNTVPPFVRTGQQEIAYTEVIAKPRPSCFPTLSVQIERFNGTNITSLDVRNSTVFKLSPITYGVTHSFTIPADVDVTTSVVRLTFDTSHYNVETDTTLLFVVPIVRMPVIEGTEQPLTTPSEDVQTAPQSDVIRYSVIAAISGAVLATLCTGSLCLLLCWLRSKRKRSNKTLFAKSSSTTEQQEAPRLQTQMSTISDHSPTTSGWTPTSESQHLLGGSRGGVGRETPVIQNSKNSQSTTPTDPTPSFLPDGAAVTDRQHENGRVIDSDVMMVSYQFESGIGAHYATVLEAVHERNNGVAATATKRPATLNVPATLNNPPSLPTVITTPPSSDELYSHHGDKLHLNCQDNKPRHEFIV